MIAKFPLPFFELKKCTFNIFFAVAIPTVELPHFFVLYFPTHKGGVHFFSGYIYEVIFRENLFFFWYFAHHHSMSKAYIVLHKVYVVVRSCLMWQQPFLKKSCWKLAAAFKKILPFFRDHKISKEYFAQKKKDQNPFIGVPFMHYAKKKSLVKINHFLSLGLWASFMHFTDKQTVSSICEKYEKWL